MKLNAFFERVIAGRWIAGPNLEDALKICARLNRRGVSVIVNYLGEDVENKQIIASTVKTYKILIDEIKKRKLECQISIKLSQIGLTLSEEIARKNYSDIISYARNKHIFVWIDMEESYYVENTINIYLSEVNKGNVGITLQSYLRRSSSDLKRLSKVNSIIRLVKGAYSGNERISFKNRSETTKNYFKLIDLALKKLNKFTVATHDTNAIKYSIEKNLKYKKDVTYAMLNGIKNDFIFDLAAKGYKTSIYVPFGERWIAYSLRRIKEPMSARLITRSLFRRKNIT